MSVASKKAVQQWAAFRFLSMGERTQSAITFKEKPEYQNQKRRRTLANNEQ